MIYVEDKKQQGDKEEAQRKRDEELMCTNADEILGLEDACGQVNSFSLSVLKKWSKSYGCICSCSELQSPKCGRAATHPWTLVHV